MKFKVCGVGDYDFTNTSGERVVGFKLNCLNESPSMEHFIGSKCEMVSCKPEVYERLRNATTDGKLVGKVIDVEYNSKGRPEQIALVTK